MSSLPHARQLVTGIIDSIHRPRDAPTPANPLSSLSSIDKHTFLTLHVLFPNELLPALDLLDRGLITRIRAALPRVEQPSVEQSYLTVQRDNRSNQHQDPGSDTPGVSRTLYAQRDQSQSRAGATGDQRALRYDDADAGQELPRRQLSTYYVRSAQQPSSRGNSRYRNAIYEHPTSYEVRLDAWSCSCPAFAFSAFPAAPASTSSTGPQDDVGPYANVFGADQSSHGWCFGGLTSGTNMPVCKHLLACVLVEHTAMFALFVEERTVSVEELAGWAAGWGD